MIHLEQTREEVFLEHIQTPRENKKIFMIAKPRRTISIWEM